MNHATNVSVFFILQHDSRVEILILEKTNSEDEDGDFS